MVSVGDKAPTFQALDQDGKEHSLADYKGQWLVLYFYPKDDTPGCTTEACGMRDAMSELQRYAHVVGVSADNIESHKQFAEKYNLNFSLLADTEKEIIRAYGADGTPFTKRITYVINPEGEIAHVYEKVDPESHAAEIIADLQKLQA